MGGGALMGGAMLGLAGVVSSSATGTVSGGKSNACVFFSKPTLGRIRWSRTYILLIHLCPVVLWLVAFTQSWTNIPWTVSAEIPADNLRDKTLAIGAFSGYISGMIVGLVSPYLQGAPANMGGKIGFIWGAISSKPGSRTLRAGPI